jgi:uncharacterized protein (TIGR02284 family)
VTPEDTIGCLNQLIETSKDGELGYRTAAEYVRNTQLQTIFQDYSRQRARFIQQLQAEVERLGGTPATSGSLTAALHRGWIDVKSALSGGDGSAIVAACETGEDAAVASYQGVLDTNISGETRSIVERQFHQVEEAHHHMRRLKESRTTTTTTAEHARGEAAQEKG